MDYTPVILDSRIPFKLIQISEGENVIYCKSFKDQLFDSGFFSTKEKDFVHNYVTENNEKYIITDVTTPDNKVYKNVKFKVVIDEKNETPYSTFNPSGKISEKKEYKLPEIKPLIIEKIEPKKIIRSENQVAPLILEKKEEKHFKTTDSDLCTLVILDGRVPFKLIQTKEGESVIFCKGFKDELLDSGLFFTKEKDFVHNYVVENGQKYIITDVTTPDDKVYKNIKFKVVINENEDTPHSIFNPEGVITENSEYKLPENKPLQIEENGFKETKPVQIDLSKNYELKKQEEEYFEKAKELQNKLIEEKVELESQKKELEKQKLLVESEKVVNEKLNDYKQIILKEFFDVSEKQEKIIKDKLSENYKLLESKIYEQNKIQTESAKSTLDLLNEKNLIELKQEIDEKIQSKQKEIEKLVEDKAENSARLLVEKADDLRKLFEDKFVVDLEEHKKDLFEKFGKLSKQVIENFVDEKAEEIVDELTKQLIEAKKEVEKQDKQEKQQEEAEEKSQLQTDVKNLVNKEIANYQKDLAEQLNDLRASIEQEIAVTAAGAGEGGGGNNSFDYYPNGGPMNGNLSFPVSGTGIVFANGQLLSSYPTGGGGGGDPAVNALVYSNSANWDLAYTNLIYNSASYLSGYDMSLINSNSANWNNTYTQYSQNSASYATIGFVNGKFLPLSGGAITGNLTIQGNLTALGTATFANTIFTTTSAVSVVNTGPGPALYVFQASGPYDVASFYDGDGVEVLHIGNANPGGNGFVGINESFPTVELSIRGAVSASKTITALGGNSDQWNSNYTSVSNNSSYWNNAYTNLVSNSSNYLSGASTSYVNTNFVKLSGDIMTGSLSAIMLSGGQIFSSGNIRVLGDGTFNRVQATIKNFYIDHPTIPGKHLQYSSLESPYIGVRLTGEDVVQNGKCVVSLPEYMRGLILDKDVHVFLTNLGHSKILYVDSIEINQNRFTVKCDALTTKWNEYKFFWSLTGIRKDVPVLEVEI